ncbi:hypothetical protein TBS_07650 [Thermobispora bispora]
MVAPGNAVLPLRGSWCIASPVAVRAPVRRSRGQEEIPVEPGHGAVCTIVIGLRNAGVAIRRVMSGRSCRPPRVVGRLSGRSDRIVKPEAQGERQKFIAIHG